jgi:hypothetical protein
MLMLGGRGAGKYKSWDDAARKPSEGVMPLHGSPPIAARPAFSTLLLFAPLGEPCRPGSGSPRAMGRAGRNPPRFDRLVKATGGISWRRRFAIF